MRWIHFAAAFKPQENLLCKRRYHFSSFFRSNFDAKVWFHVALQWTVFTQFFWLATEKMETVKKKH